MCGRSNLMVQSSGDNVPHHGTLAREPHCCQHPKAAWGLGPNGMANESELLINVDMVNKPKVLTGLTKMVRGQEQDSPVVLLADVDPPAKRRSLTRSWRIKRNRISPYSPSCKGRNSTARKSHGNAGRGVPRKRTLCCNGMDSRNSCTRKGADFDMVSEHEERRGRFMKTGKGEK